MVDLALAGISGEVGNRLFGLTFSLRQWEALRVFCILFRLPGVVVVANLVSERGGQGWVNG